MATISMTQTSNSISRGDVVITKWTPLGQGDDGEPISLEQFADRTVQVTGTFGTGAALIIQGSLDGTNWSPLTDPQGLELLFSATGLQAVMELVPYLRPIVSGGDGTTALTVQIIARKN